MDHRCVRLRPAHTLANHARCMKQQPRCPLSLPETTLVDEPSAQALLHSFVRDCAFCK